MEKINEKWLIYKKEKNEKIREELINFYLPIVKYQVDRIISYLPDEIKKNDKEDLYIEGIIGLIEAIERFDIQKNVKFETFASKRIRGAVLDFLRKKDILPRSMREKVKNIEKTYFLLENKLGRPANDDEIIKELGMTKEEFYDILLNAKGIVLIPFEQSLGESEENLLNLVGKDDNVLEEYEKNNIKEIIAELIDKLEKEEKLILELYYFDELTLKEIGKILNISESRVCQIHTKIILKLRSQLHKLEKKI